MKKETTRIARMLQGISAGSAWHGQSVTDTLAGITASEAAAHPISDSHSIWDYLQHIINWRVYTLRNILDDKPFEVKLNSEADWTPITDTSEAAWQTTLAAFKKSTDNLATAIEAMEDAKLSESVFDNKFKYYVLVQGIIQHDIYHSGQIVLLKKMLKSK